MESLAYTFLEMFQAILPWEDISRKNAYQREKELWTGHDIAPKLPPVFGDFLDYTRGLKYEEEPDYARWREAFGALTSESTSMGPVTMPAYSFLRRSESPISSSSDSEPEDDENVSGDSDDDYLPISASGSEPQRVAICNLFGDEDTIVRDNIRLIKQIPLMLTPDLRNGNERLSAPTAVDEDSLIRQTACLSLVDHVPSVIS